jgi:pimeloyl-ACP methyl ester carboxylesterase
MSAITVGGDLVHYEVLGRGRPVILVHGWLGSWRYWIPAMQVLQLKYRVYALDLYGFGDSGRNPAKYNLEHQTELLADFMQQLGIPKAAMIGHSLGALVVAEFARRYQDRVPRLLLVSAPLFDPGNLDKRVPAGRKMMLTVNKPEPPAVEPSAQTIMSPSAAMRAALLEAARARANGQPPAAPPELTDITMPRSEVHIEDDENPLLKVADQGLENLLARCFKRNEPEFEKLRVDVVKTDSKVFRTSITTFSSGRMLDTLRLLPMPAVLIHGMEDPLIPLPDEEVWSYLTLDKENILFPIPLPNVRHFPMLEYGNFTRVVGDFLEAPDVSKLEIKERWRRRTR